MVLEWRMPLSPEPRRWMLVAALVCGAAAVVAGAELREQTSRAYAEYEGHARQAFIDRVTAAVPWGSATSETAASADAALRSGRVLAGPGGGDGIMNVPGGLVHHWRAALFLADVTLDHVVRVSRSYADYPTIFGPIVAARLLTQDGDSFRVQLRMRESAAGMSATLDVWSSIRYVRVDARHAYSVSRSDEIREVKDAGRPTEGLLPEGRDSGYLWRAGAFTRFVEDDGGVLMEMETVGLSRPFPRMLGWLIEPIARRIGRRSAETSVAEFRRAVLARQ